MVTTVHTSIRSVMCWLTVEATPSTSVPPRTGWPTSPWKAKVGFMALNKDDNADETCSEKVVSYVWRCHGDQQQVLANLHLSLPLSDPLWDPSLVSLQKSTHRYPGDIPHGSRFFWLLWPSFRPPSLPFFLPQGSPIIAGTCWPFVGAEGTLAVSLSHPIRITHVTVDHLPRYNSPSGDIRSAPRDLELHVSQHPSSLTPDQLWCLVMVNNLLYHCCGLLPQGLKTQAGEGTFLLRFRYDKGGEPTQTFSLPVSPNLLKSDSATFLF